MLKHISNIVKNISKKVYNNTGNQTNIQGSASQQVDFSFDNVLKFNTDILNHHQDFIQIKRNTIFKILNDKDLIKDSSQLTVLMVCMEMLNRYSVYYNKKDKKINAKKIHEHLKEIGNGKALVGKSTIQTVLNYFYEKGILIKNDDGTSRLIFARATKDNCENFLRLDLKTLHEMYRRVDTPNSFTVLFYFYSNFERFAIYNKFFSHAYSTITSDLGYKIKSFSTFSKILKELESKNLLFVKHAKPFTNTSNQYCISEGLFENLIKNLPHYNCNEKVDDNVNNTESNTNAESQIPEIGVGQPPFEAENSKNWSNNNRYKYKIDHLSSDESFDEGKKENEVLPELTLEDLIKNLENDNTENKKPENKSVKDVKFDIPEEEPEIIIEEPKEKNVKENRANFGLRDKYNLSSYAFKNLSKLRKLIKSNKYFDSHSHNQLLYKVFDKLENQGGWPFQENKREIKIPFDIYLLNDKDNTGTIFEKILNDIKYEFEEKKRIRKMNTPEEKAKKEYQEKVSFLMNYDNGKAYNEYDKLNADALQKLNDFERSILKKLKPWHVDHQKVTTKLNLIINYLVEYRYEELQGYKPTNDEEVIDKNLDLIFDICRKFRLLNYFDGALSEYDFQKSVNPDLTKKEVEQKTKEYLKHVTRNNPEFNRIDFGI